MPDPFHLRPKAIGFVNYGFISRQDANSDPNWNARTPGAPGVLLNKARSGNGPAGTGLDSKKNFSWQDRAVFPGSLPLPNGKIMMYYDDNNTPFLLSFGSSFVGKDYTFNVAVLNEYGLIGTENYIDEYNIQLPTITFTAQPGDDFTLRSTFNYEQSPDCRSVFLMPFANFDESNNILGNTKKRALAAIVRVDISGVVQKGAVNAGLTFNQTIFKTTAECSPKTTVENITSSSQLTTEQQAVVNGAITDTNGKRVISESIRYAYFDNNGGTHFYGFRAERTTYHVRVKPEDTTLEVASPCFEDVNSIYLNGAAVETRTTSSCNYYVDNPSLPVDNYEGGSWDINNTSFNDPFYSAAGLDLYYKGIWQDNVSANDVPWIYIVDDPADDGIITTSPQPTLYASDGFYSHRNIADRFIAMSSYSPTNHTSTPLLPTTVHSGYGTKTLNNFEISNLAYDHVNGVIVEFSNIWNQGGFQQIPPGFVSADTVFY